MVKLYLKVWPVIALFAVMVVVIVINTVGPCDSDDGTSQYPICYWNAANRGDGNGNSFIMFGETMEVVF